MEADQGLLRDTNNHPRPTHASLTNALYNLGLPSPPETKGPVILDMNLHTEEWFVCTGTDRVDSILETQ